MSREQLSRQLAKVCEELGVTEQEVRFGRQRHRTARMATVVRALFILRARRMGAKTTELCAVLEVSKHAIQDWLREFRARGLIPSERMTEPKEVY